MSYVLFTATGDTDPTRGGYDGPVMHIVRHFRPAAVYIFLTSEMNKRDEEKDYFKKSINFILPECRVVKFRHPEITDPSDFDAFHELFDRYIDRIHDENPESDILVNISSATPQIKATMCLEVVTHRLPLIPVQVKNPENSSGSGIPHFNDKKDDVLKELAENHFDNLPDAQNRCSQPNILSFKKGMIKAGIKSLIKNCDYAGAYDLVKNNKSLFSKDAMNLLRHASSRCTADNKEAESAAREMSLDRILYPVQESSAKKTCEYYLIMKMKRVRGEIADFTLRLFPLAEALALKYIEKNNPRILDIFEEKKGLRINQSKADEIMPGLLDYLDSVYNAAFRDLNVNLKPLVAIMRFLELEKSVIDNFEIIESMRTIRNDGAHQLKPVSENDFVARGHKSNEVCEIIEKLIRCVYKTEIKNDIFGIYETINARIEEALDRTEE